MPGPTDFPDLVDALCSTCQSFGARGWCRATSGNFSARTGDGTILITRSGREKCALSADDLMICTPDGLPVDATQSPSAETPLHSCLYRLDADINAVLHTHSVTSTILSRRASSAIAISGFEMQKAFAGVTTHEESFDLIVYDNDQDMDALAARLADDHAAGRLTLPGFLIRGHGLTAWGRDVAEARRHVEGFEFLFECLWRETPPGRL